MKQFITILCLLPFVGFAQVQDDFSDGDFTHNPIWSGSDTVYIVNPNKQLQLNTKGSGTAYLSLENSQPLINCEWRFSIRLDFSPSSANYARIYLVSNNRDLSKSLNGYYLQFGKTGSDDRIELFRQTGNTGTSVCRGETLIANTFELKIKVTRDSLATWRIYSSPISNTNYTLEAEGSDTIIATTAYFGISCVYTSTNANKFFFDDFYIYSQYKSSYYRFSANHF